MVRDLPGPVVGEPRPMLSESIDGITSIGLNSVVDWCTMTP